MKPYSKYIFEQSDTAKSAYLLKEIHGFVFPDFPATYKLGARKGLQYITFADPYNEKLKKKFDKCLYLDKKRYLTGLNFTQLDPVKSHGDNKNIGFNDCLLVEFSADFKLLTLYFIKDMANQKQTVFDKWLAGEVLEVVDSELLPINEKAASRKG